MARPDRCIIVGSGPSAAGFKCPDGIAIISVKRTITWLDRADYWFALDPDAAVEAMAPPRPGVQYFCAAPEKFALPPHVTRLERVAERGREPYPRHTAEWWLWRWHGVRTLCTRVGAVHTGNSAWGALGLAFHLGFRDVLLVGVDGSSAPRIEGGRPNNLSHLPLLFASALPQIKLQTVSVMSGIPKTTLAEWLAE